MEELAHTSQWETTAAQHLCRKSFIDLLDGKVPVLLERSFIDRDTAQKLEDKFSPRLSPYVNSTGPALLKIGVAQFEFQAQSEEDLKRRTKDEKDHYFQEVAKYSEMHKEIAKIAGENIWAKVVKKIASVVPDWDVELANEGAGKQYFSGVLRAINESTPIHCDWSPYDSRTEDWMINRVTKQAVFNLYLTPVKGGQTIVHDVQWTPKALEFRDPESYGYSPEIVDNSENFTIQPQPGDLVLFNSRNMHQVLPVTLEPSPGPGTGPHWRRPRLTMSSFIGYLPASPGGRPKLVLWS